MLCVEYTVVTWDVRQTIRRRDRTGGKILNVGMEKNRENKIN